MPVHPPTASVAPDCRHYRGDKPCVHNRLCAGCGHYAPVSHRICIIKLGALGDVIRTLCILPSLRAQHPGAHITWVSLPNGCRMIQGHPLIDRTLSFDATTALVLGQESFDTVVSLDKEPAPCALASSLRAGRKLGVGLSTWGTPVPLNAEAEEYFNLGLSDKLKFRVNTKSYPRLVHEALGLRYDGQRYELPLDAERNGLARLSLATHGWDDELPTLGINVGAGKVFANKMWPESRIVELIRALREASDEPQVVLLGGPDEQTALNGIYRATRNLGGVFHSGGSHSEPAFVALVNACDVVFTGDTMAMHVAVALGKGVVAYFGPTCEQEIDLFGKGEKLVAQVPCGPCYKRQCDHDDACVGYNSIDEAVAATNRVMGRVRTGALSLPVIPRRLAG